MKKPILRTELVFALLFIVVTAMTVAQIVLAFQSANNPSKIGEPTKGDQNIPQDRSE